ncbi:MAG: PTS sugar transporter subunit IIA [Bradymonadia bacterium]
MRLSDFLQIEAVDPQLGASNKKGVLRAIVGLLLRVEPQLAPNEVVHVLEQREALQSTGIGNGIAIPHGRLESLSKPIAALGLSQGGIDFDSLDGGTTHLFFTVLVPSDAQGLHLKILARVSRLLADSDTLNQLMSAKDQDELFAAFVAGDSKL